MKALPVSQVRSRLGLDMATPCETCPFLKPNPMEYDPTYLFDYLHGMFKKGTFVHTCHSTDQEADLPERAEAKKLKRQGKIQHCIGAIKALRRRNIAPMTLSNYQIEQIYGRIDAYERATGPVEVYTEYEMMLMTFDNILNDPEADLGLEEREQLIHYREILREAVKNECR
jgi:hypothetical protein